MKKKDCIVIGILLIICAVGYFLYSTLTQGEKEYAVVYYHNEEIDELDLSIDDIYTYEGDYGSFSLEVKNQEYHATNVDCPNHDCENVGWVKKGSTVSIICVPNDIYVQQVNIDTGEVD